MTEIEAELFLAWADWDRHCLTDGHYHEMACPWTDRLERAVASFADQVGKSRREVRTKMGELRREEIAR